MHLAQLRVRSLSPSSQTQLENFVRSEGKTISTIETKLIFSALKVEVEGKHVRIMLKCSNTQIHEY